MSPDGHSAALSGIGPTAALFGFGVGLVAAVALGAIVELAFVRRFARASRLVLTVATIGITQLLAACALLVPQMWDRSAASQRIDAPVDWKITGLLPDDPPRVWKINLPQPSLPAAPSGFAVRVVNPLPNGMPLRFANSYHGDLPDDWLLLP